MLLSDLYQGSEEYYGQLVNGKYFTVKGKITPEVWKEHLLGNKRLGVIPQRNGRLKFASIDVDIQGQTFNQVIKNRLDDLGLKYVVEKSKSKGFHYNIFFREWVNADMVQKFLFEEFRKRYSVEVYPTNPNNPVGNFINVPYFGLKKGIADTYFLGYPYSLPWLVPVNDKDVIRPVITIETPRYEGSDDAERALRTDCRHLVPELSQKMYCLFYRNQGKTKSASYFQGPDNVWFYKEFGRMEEGKDFVLNNIDLVSRRLEIDRLQAIYYILDGDVKDKEKQLRIIDAVEEIGTHKLFKRYGKLRPFINFLANWIVTHSQDGRAFVSQRFLAQQLGYNLTTIEYLTNITCLLGLWLKDGSSVGKGKCVTLFRMLKPNVVDLEARADILAELPSRKMKPELLVELGFEWVDVARAFVNKGDCYKLMNGISIPQL